MFPWEHVLFAYVSYSAYVRVRFRVGPADRPVAALALGSLFPDLVDKPLAWQFSLFDTGWGVAHSAFFAVVVSAAAYAFARHRGVDRIGSAFGFGYLLHLVGDVLPASLSRGTLYLHPILWPVGSPTSKYRHESYVGGVHTLLTDYAVELLTLDPTPVVVLQLGSVVLGVGLWIADGRPGLRLVTDLPRGVLAASRRSGE